MAKPIYTFCHAKTTQQEKIEIFMAHSHEFKNVPDKQDAVALGRAYEAFQKRMKDEQVAYNATHPRLGNLFPELRKLKVAK